VQVMAARKQLGECFITDFVVH